MIQAKITGGPSMWGFVIDSLTKSDSLMRHDLREVDFIVSFLFEGRKV